MSWNDKQEKKEILFHEGWKHFCQLTAQTEQEGWQVQKVFQFLRQQKKLFKRISFVLSRFMKTRSKFI